MTSLHLERYSEYQGCTSKGLEIHNLFQEEKNTLVKNVLWAKMFLTRLFAIFRSDIKSCFDLYKYEILKSDRDCKAIGKK